MQSEEDYDRDPTDDELADAIIDRAERDGVSIPDLMDTSGVYIFRTDAVSEEIEADGIDEAARQFAEGEGFRSRDAEALFSEIKSIDGAWLVIETPDGDRIDSRHD